MIKVVFFIHQLIFSLLLKSIYFSGHHWADASAHIFNYKTQIAFGCTQDKAFWFLLCLIIDGRTSIVELSFLQRSVWGNFTCIYQTFSLYSLCKLLYIFNSRACMIVGRSGKDRQSSIQSTVNRGDWWAFNCNQWTGLSWGYGLMWWFQYDLIFNAINLRKCLVYFHWLCGEGNGLMWFLLHQVPMLLLTQEYKLTNSVVRNWPC